MYNSGTLEEFEAWHEQVKNLEGLPKIGYINNIPMPGNQQTIAYSNAIQNPGGGNDYIWAYGNYPDANKPELLMEDVKLAGWFPDED
jgi:hypothetical protein